jgi:hypothetical protein
MVIGHVAVSVLEHRYLKVELVPVLVAGIFPDLVDKALCQLLHVTPFGRMYAHTLAAMALSTLVVGLIWGRHVAWSWGLGYLSHLVCDLGGFLPWLYPFVHYDFPHRQHNLVEILRPWLLHPAGLALEVALLAWAAWAWLWPLLTARTPGLRSRRAVKRQ